MGFNGNYNQESVENLYQLAFSIYDDMPDEESASDEENEVAAEIANLLNLLRHSELRSF